MMPRPGAEILLDQARLLVSRLERISADSIWAHRSSGLRGELLRWIDRVEAGGPVAGLGRLEALIGTGYWMLEQAARERIGA